MTAGGEHLDGGRHRGAIVDHHRIHRRIVDGSVHGHHRDPAFNGSVEPGHLGADRDDDDAVNHLAQQEANGFGFSVRVSAGIGDDGAVAGFAKAFLHGRHHRGVEGAIELVEDHTQGHGSAAAQPAGHVIDLVAKLRHGLFDQFGIRRQDVAAIEVFGDRRQRQPGQASDVLIGRGHDPISSAKRFVWQL